MKKKPSFDDLLDALYLSATEPEMRMEFLRRSASYFDCPAIGFIVNCRPERGSHAGLLGLSAEARRLYESHYAVQDPWYVGYARAGVVPAPRGRVFIGRGSSVVSEVQLRATEYWNDFGRKHHPDAIYQAGIVTESIALTMVRGPRQHDWSDQAIHELRRLYPHLRRAFEVHERVLDLREAMEAAQAAVDALDVGLIGLDKTGTVAFLNRSAEAIVNRAEGLAAKGGRLIFCSPALDGQFTRWLRQAADPHSLGAGRDGMTVWGNRGAVHLSLLPVTPADCGIPGRAKLVLLVTDDSAGPKSRSQLLSALFSLTPAEARVAMLLTAGYDPGEIAGQTRTTADTVRFQLKSIYRKTGARRQSALVRLISRLPGA